MPAVIIGALVCEVPSLLTEEDLRRWCVAFTGHAIPKGTNIHELSIALMVEGEQDKMPRQLGLPGKVTYAYTDTYAIQGSIVAWQNRKKKPRAEFASPQIALGIGSKLFCAATLAFFSLQQSTETRGTVSDLIGSLDARAEWAAIWVNAEKPQELRYADLSQYVRH